jgi:hypothetical protein
MDNALLEKRKRIMKLGAAILAFGRTTGVILSEVDENVFRVSLSDAGVNWTDNIPIDRLEVGGYIQQVNTKNEYMEKEDEGCEGGACKI